MKERLGELGHLARLGSRVLRPVGAGPELLCVFVTSRCDARCVHCFDHARRGPEVEAAGLSTEELVGIARKVPSPYFLLLTGGEPFLQPDLARIAVAFARHAKPRVLAIPTSGSRPEVILAAVERMLAGFPDGVQLSVNVSIDGVGPLHDEIRGVTGLFDRAIETIAGLRELAAGEEKLGVGVVTVVSRMNQDHLREIMRLVLDELRLPVWAPFLTRGEPRDPAAGDVEIDRYVEVARELEQRVLLGRYSGYTGFLGARLNNGKNVIRREIIHRTVLEGRRVVPCLAGRHSAVVWGNGDVHPCELLAEPMGNLRDYDYDLGRLWRDEPAKRARAAVGSAGCACTHENTLTTSVAFDHNHWVPLLRWAFAFPRFSDAPTPAPPGTGGDAPRERVEAAGGACVEPEVVCLVPALNEEVLITSTVSILDRVLGHVSRSHRIIVVDDGSSDRTCERVEGLNNPRISAVRCEDGPSFRGNLAARMREASGELIFYMDADLTASEADFGALLARLRAGVDVAAGSRYAPGARVIRTPVRLAMSLTYNRMLRALFDSPFLDHQCGLKGFRREALAEILSRMTGSHADRRWFWDAEVLIRAHWLGLRVEEVPVSWACRLDSRFMLPRQLGILPWFRRLLAEKP